MTAPSTLFGLLESTAPTDRLAVASTHQRVSWGELLALVTRYLEELAPLRASRVGVAMMPRAEHLAALAVLEHLPCDVWLFDAHLDPAVRDRLAIDHRLGTILEWTGKWNRTPRADGGAASGAASVTLLTSGTTGAPKAVTHSWASLARPVRRQDGRPPVWLLSYRPHLYAGTQVVLQSIANGGTLVAVDPTDPVDAIVSQMVEHRVELASATPSFWRRLLLLGNPQALASVPLRQITLGGEATDQPVLDRLGRTFPDARIAHIYATTELGRCFSVGDRRAGFPASYLEAPTPDGIVLQVDRGQLLVRPVNGAESAGTEWTHTGDLVELRGDRYHFIGRESEIINVAGAKVHPLPIEELICTVPGVRAARVYPRGSSLAGQLVACDVTIEEGGDPAAIERAVRDRCGEALTPQQRPRFVTIVGDVRVSAAGKTVRGG